MVNNMADDELGDHHEDDEISDQISQRAQLGEADLGPGQYPPPDTQPPGEDDTEEAGQGHDAEAADLDESEDHQLSER